ncbi:MAG: tRNA preQ1(34) S-adenosylmethionine ribosyltransferase-isomerase QueA [Actinobacteria bacterium]|nr:tRNA preQ1(34) S-adenosylmethionine ribosyltransferase-isomerase QueA [Actinomycetota bacterium]
MRTDDLDYDLPEGAIAQAPVEPRDAARLLVDCGPAEAPEHRFVRDLPELLCPGDLLVVNDSRVIPARLRLHKATGAAVEVLLLERGADGWWQALVRPGRRVRSGAVLTHGDLAVEVGDDVGDDLGDGRRRVRLLVGDARLPAGPDGELAALAAHGEVPLPPYIHTALREPERYQTVFADRPGSVAAPTAGLHLTEGVLARCAERGADLARVELVVGLGTFRPIAADRVEDHVMHAERYRVDAGTWARIQAAPRVVAVGTTVVRTLESVAATGELEGRTALYLHGDAPFAVVDRLLTNFHVPRSSLLALVDAFVGARWRRLYETALADGYRFLSFGDAMLLDRSRGRSG